MSSAWRQYAKPLREALCFGLTGYGALFNPCHYLEEAMEIKEQEFEQKKAESQYQGHHESAPKPFLTEKKQDKNPNGHDNFKYDDE